MKVSLTMVLRLIVIVLTRSPHHCVLYCGPQLPYMYYDGDDFCVTKATKEGRWRVSDTSQGIAITDSSVTVTCED